MRCRKLYEVYGIRPSTNTNVNSNTNTKIATPAQTCSTIFIILGIKQVVSISAIECWTSDWSWPRGLQILVSGQSAFYQTSSTSTIIYSYILYYYLLIYTVLLLYSYILNRTPLLQPYSRVYVVWPTCTLLSWLPRMLKKTHRTNHFNINTFPTKLKLTHFPPHTSGVTTVSTPS